MKTQRRFNTIKKDGTVSSYPVVSDTLRDRFKLQKKLGEGSFSVTYKAIDTHNNNEFRTLKVYGKSTEVIKSLADIKAETKTLVYLDHPSLPRCYGLHEAEYTFLELEYIEGQTLEQKISRIITRKDKISYAQQLAESLFHLHYKKIEHKDIKPENILITKNKQLYLIDFGVAAIINKEKDVGGTLEYCPPETLKKNEKKFQRDIFAYGIVLYKMFHGKYPFKINGEIDYTLPAHLITSDDPYNKIIKKCLEYFSEDRYTNFQEIIDDLEKASSYQQPVIKTITQYVVRTVSNNNMTEDFKKDLKYLWLNMLFLLMLLPCFFYVQNQSNYIERMVQIDSRPYSVYVNGHYVGTSETDTVLKKGDLVTFTGANDMPVFEMTVNNEKAIDIAIHGNRVFLNNKLRGIILTRDEKIPRGVKFIAIRGNVQPSRLQRLKRNDLHVALASSAPDSLINYIPGNIRSLSLRNNNHVFDLQDFRRFRELESLDLTRAENTDLSVIPPMENLKVLNLQRTRTRDISALSRLPALKHLNLESNQVSDIHTLLDNRNIETLNLNNNDNIQSIFPLTFMSKLKEVSNNNPATIAQEPVVREYLKNQYNESQRIQQIFTKKTNDLQMIVNILVIVAISAIIAQILKLILKKRNPTNPPNSAPKSPEEQSPRNTPKGLFNANSLKPIDSAISNKRYFTPEKDNALHYLSENINDFPDEAILKDKKKEVLDLINNKVTDHLERKEYEPVILASSAINNYFPNRKNKKRLKKAMKKLPKPDKIKWISVRKGSFQMGDFQKNSFKVHEVDVNKFKISETAVTNKQFVEFLNSEGNKTEQGQTWFKMDSQYSKITLVQGVYVVTEPYDSFPVYEVSWYGAQRFAEWLGGRLPTEAEWEFAAREAGKKIIFATGNSIDKNAANFLVDPNDSLWHSVFPVKSFPPNKLGIYEMSGNILEWCYDWHDVAYYEKSAKNNPMGPKSGEMKVVRGGAWCFPKEQSFTYYRSALKPSSRNNYTGFRVVLP